MLVSGMTTRTRRRSRRVADRSRVDAVQRGYIAIAPATRGLATVASLPDLKGRHGKRPCRAQLIHALLAGRTAVGERVWGHPAAAGLGDEARGGRYSAVVMLGNSGGGVLTL